MRGMEKMSPMLYVVADYAQSRLSYCTRRMNRPISTSASK